MDIVRYTKQEYADLMGCTKEDISKLYGDNVVAFITAYRGSDESAFLGMHNADGSYSVCGLRRDEDNITYEHMIEVLESGF